MPAPAEHGVRVTGRWARGVRQNRTWRPPPVNARPRIHGAQARRRRKERFVSVPLVHVVQQGAVEKIGPLAALFDHPDVRPVAEQSLVADAAVAEARLEPGCGWNVTHAVVRAILVAGAERFGRGQSALV